MSAQGLRPRTVSSPIPYTPSPSSSRPISPGKYFTQFVKFLYASHSNVPWVDSLSKLVLG